jgi:hypothetical protein
MEQESEVMTARADTSRAAPNGESANRIAPIRSFCAL